MSLNNLQAMTSTECGRKFSSVDLAVKTSPDRWTNLHFRFPTPTGYFPGHKRKILPWFKDAIILPSCYVVFFERLFTTRLRSVTDQSGSL